MFCRGFYLYLFVLILSKTHPSYALNALSKDIKIHELRCQQQKERKALPLSCWQLALQKTSKQHRIKNGNPTCSEEEVRRLSRKELIELIQFREVSKFCLQLGQREKQRRDYIIGNPMTSPNEDTSNNEIPEWWREK